MKRKRRFLVGPFLVKSRYYDGCATSKVILHGIDCSSVTVVKNILCNVEYDSDSVKIILHSEKCKSVTIVNIILHSMTRILCFLLVGVRESRELVLPSNWCWRI